MNEKIKLKNITKDVNVNLKTLEELTNTLSHSEMKCLFQLFRFVNKDNVLVYKAKPATVRELSVAAGENYDMFRRTFRELKKREIVTRVRLSLPEYPQGKRIHVFNPWIYSKGNAIHLEILNLFKDSKWKTLVDPNKDSRFSFEYAVWEEKVKARDNCQCVICGENFEIEVHHISPYSTDYQNRTNPKNGICLCKKHHNSKSPISFHNSYGTVNNTKEQLQEYIDLQRKSLGLSLIKIEDIIEK